MAKAVDVAKDDFATVRTGRNQRRALPEDPRGLLRFPDAPRAAGVAADPRGPHAHRDAYDKTALKEIERSIATFPNLGASPTNDGEIVRVTIPELTQDRRKEFVKLVRGKGEDHKVVIRNIRRKAKDDLDALKGEISDDEIARGDKDLEVLTKKHVDLIDEALKKKEAELLEV